MLIHGFSDTGVIGECTLMIDRLLCTARRIVKQSRIGVTASEHGHLPSARFDDALWMKFEPFVFSSFASLFPVNNNRLVMA